jgi:hypothetical protein|tara:strand:- start:4851 stop:5123 length:273 start_codon:yes stop_codon:yes gene_type:complete
MNRVRLGLTGLALVFLLVMAAAILLRPPAEPEPKAKEDPLATLGVAPGADKNTEPAPELPPSVLQTPPLDTPEPLTDPLVIDESKDLTEI